MISHENFFKTPHAQEFLKELRQELLYAQRPANQIIFDESELCAYLKISKRHAANLRSSGAITYSKAGGKLYYKLSDVLEYIDRNKVNAIKEDNKFFKL